MPEMPWAPRTRSMQGRQTEQQIAKKYGARVHPMSGAGSIKDDASSSEDLYEIKDANLSHTIKAKDLEALFRRAVRKGLEAKYVIYFRSVGLEATITLRKADRPGD